MTSPQISEEELLSEVLAASGAPAHDTPYGDGFVDARGVLWQRRERPPMSEHHRIFAIFHDSDDVRIYCIPSGAGYPPNGFKRYTVERAPKRTDPRTGSPACVMDSMTRAVFVREVATEFWDAYEESIEGADLQADADAMRACLTKVTLSSGADEKAALAAECLKNLTMEEEEVSS